MTRNDLTTALNTALNILQPIAEGTGRIAKADRENITAFIAATREALARPARERTPVWRIAEVYNPKSGRVVNMEVKADGLFYPKEARTYGIDRAPEWWQIEAETRAIAVRLISEGKATRYGRRDGQTVEVETPTIPAVPPPEKVEVPAKVEVPEKKAAKPKAVRRKATTKTQKAVATA